MNKYIQSTFRGGMNQFVDPTRIMENEYPLLVNGRVRYDVIEPVAKPVLQTSGVPEGNFQGLYAAGVYLLLFVSGVAYYRDAQIEGNFIPVPNWTTMDADVSVIYAQEVGSSTVNQMRKLADSTGNAGGGVLFMNPVTASPVCVICQDGVSQPQLITPQPDSRLVNTFDQWTVNNREYVPVGKNMFTQGGVLYVLSPDGRKIYRSVTGRPLDFCIAVDVDGNKTQDANAMAHFIGFSVLTGIFPSNSSEGMFIASTPNGSTMVIPSSSSLFGEPLFANVPLFKTGVLNQFSYIDVNGDACFIDGAGVRSFNAVLQLKNTGRNSPFSAPVNNLFAGIRQTAFNCCASFDDYALFSMNTKYGKGIIIYDTIYQKFVGLDIPTFEDEGEAIKQFAVIELVGIRKLFGITTSHHLYELNASLTEVEETGVYLGEWTSDDPKSEQKVVNVRVVLNDVLSDGIIYASLYNDRSKAGEIPSNVISPIEAVTPPIVPPFGIDPQIDSVKNIVFFFNDIADSAWKVGVWIRWAFKAKLSHIVVESEALALQNDLEQSSQQYASIMEGEPNITSMSPYSGGIGTVVTLGGSNFTGVTEVSMGGVSVPVFSTGPSFLQLTIPAGVVTNKIKLTKPNSFVETPQTFTVT